MLFTSVISSNLRAPPSAPVAGDRYIVLPGYTAVDAWAGHEGQLAEWSGSAWAFSTLGQGDIIWDTRDRCHITLDQDGWLTPLVPRQQLALVDRPKLSTVTCSAMTARKIASFTSSDTWSSDTPTLDDTTAVWGSLPAEQGFHAVFVEAAPGDELCACIDVDATASRGIIARCTEGTIFVSGHDSTNYKSWAKPMGDTPIVTTLDFPGRTDTLSYAANNALWGVRVLDGFIAATVNGMEIQRLPIPGELIEVGFGFWPRSAISGATISHVSRNHKSVFRGQKPIKLLIVGASNSKEARRWYPPMTDMLMSAGIWVQSVDNRSGVGGAASPIITTDDALLNLQTLGVGDATHCIIDVGQNDWRRIGTSFPQISVAQSVSNLSAILDILQAAGVAVIGMVQPLYLSQSSADPNGVLGQSYEKAAPYLAAHLHTYGIKSVPVFDANQALGPMVDGRQWSEDNVHIRRRERQLLSLGLASVLAGVIL